MCIYTYTCKRVFVYREPTSILPNKPIPTFKKLCILCRDSNLLDYLIYL